jgi:hypothetical protein
VRAGHSHEGKDCVWMGCKDGKVYLDRCHSGEEVEL